MSEVTEERGRQLAKRIRLTMAPLYRRPVIVEHDREEPLIDFSEVRLSPADFDCVKRLIDLEEIADPTPSESLTEGEERA